MSDDLTARLAVFARLLEAEWYNGNMKRGAYERLNADLTGLVAVYIRPTLTLPIGEPAIHRHDGLGDHPSETHHRPGDFR